MKHVVLSASLGMLLSVGPAYSQLADLSFGHLALEEGLSQLSVYAIVQDQTGFMWFATEDGLNRYDGYSMKTYLHNPLDSTSLSDKAIIALFVDRFGDLWAGTNRGLNRYDRVHDKFVRYLNNPEDSTTLSHNKPFAIYEDSDSVLWVGTGNGLNIFHRSNSTFSRIKSDPSYANSLVHNSVRSICQDKDGRLWIGTAVASVSTTNQRRTSVDTGMIRRTTGV